MSVQKKLRIALFCTSRLFYLLQSEHLWFISCCYFCEMSHADLLMGTFLPPTQSLPELPSQLLPLLLLTAACGAWDRKALNWLRFYLPHTECSTAAFQTLPAHILLSTRLLSERGNLICRSTCSRKCIGTKP